MRWISSRKLGWISSKDRYKTVCTQKPNVPTSVIRYNNASGAVRANSSNWSNQNLWWGSFSGSDNGISGINHYEYSTGCSGSKSGDLSSYHSYSNGTNYTFCIRSVDNAGNASGWSGAYYFKVDTTVPTCVGTKTKTGTSSGVTISFTCSDTGGSKKVQSDSDPSQLCTTILSSQPLRLGLPCGDSWAIRSTSPITINMAISQLPKDPEFITITL